MLFMEARGRRTESGRHWPRGGQLDEALFLLVLSILLLSTLDAIFTLVLLETGQVHEWNPFLAPLIETDVQRFANVKSALTTGGVFLLVVFVDRSLLGRVPVRKVLEAIFVAYCLVIAYHLSLMAWLILHP
jgi:hypothetical protein